MFFVFKKKQSDFLRCPLTYFTFADGTYPLVNIQKTMENHHFIAGKIHQNWPFSIAMLNYQRVTYGVTIPQKGPSSASIFLSSSWDAMAVAAVAAVANTMFG